MTAPEAVRQAAAALTFFATASPDDPARVTYWQRVGDSLSSWPPSVTYVPPPDPADIPRRRRRAYLRAWYRGQRPWSRAVHRAVNADPPGCGARFAVLQGRCMCCGRSLSDPASVSYGVDLDCRRPFPASVLAELAEAVSRARAAEAGGGPLRATESQDSAHAGGTGTARRPG